MSVEDDYKRRLRRKMWEQMNEWRFKNGLPLEELPKELRDE